MVETYKSKNRYGWRVRNLSGVIEVSDPAVFTTTTAAMANAEQVMRLMMTHFGVVEFDDGSVNIDAGKVA